MFQILQRFLGILIGASLDAFGFRGGMLEDLVSTALGIRNEGLFIDQVVGFVAGQLQGAVGLFLSLGHVAVFFRIDLLGLFHFLRDGDAHLVNDIQELVLIDDDVVGQRDGAAVIEEFFQAVN